MGNETYALGNVMVDCADEKSLQNFYAELLGWEKATLFARPAVKSPNGIVFLFCEESDYVPPVWPEETGKQQKQMHFDFQVTCVADAVKHAEALGARKAAEQFGGDAFVTMFDPAGHPFCLCRKDTY
ncbi:MAG: VOC family protein [Lachnospiraceae bacterium]